MTVSSVYSAATTSQTSTAKSGTPALGQADFLKLLTTQMTTQDPTDPVDNKEMVAQMAQFSSLAGITEMADTLKAISAKLDVVLAGQVGKPAAEDDAASETATASTDIPVQE